MGMFKGTIAAALVLAGVLAASENSMASSVLIDDGSYTHDSATGLDWLDVTATTGFSYDDVINNNGVSYVADGWHYATKADFLTLAADAGVPVFVGPNDPAYSIAASNALALINLFGPTSILGAYTESLGMLGDQLSNETVATADLFVSPFVGVQIDLSNITSDTTQGLPDKGSFLIRDTEVAATPLPGASILFMSGLGLIGFVAWRNKRGGFARSIAG
jgi:hypothetical protein